MEDRGGGDNSEIRLAIRDTDSNGEADSYDIEVRADGGDIISEEAALPGNPDDGAWHHIALIRSGTTARLFYDGVYTTLTDSATSSSTSSFPSPRTILMGAQWETDAGGPPATRNELDGDLDETRISLTARPQEYFQTQVANVNSSAPGGFYDFLTGEETPATLLGRYWFNEAPSGQGPTTVFDDQPSPVNLTTIVYDAPVAWTVDNGHRGLNGAPSGRPPLAVSASPVSSPTPVSELPSSYRRQSAG